MSIIGTLPVTLTNGTTADATQVMADFNFIVSQVNANGISTAGGVITGSLTVTGNVAAGNSLQTGDIVLGDSAGFNRLYMSFAGSYVWQYNTATGTLVWVGNGMPLMSIDINGNIIAKGTITQNGTPAT